MKKSVFFGLTVIIAVSVAGPVGAISDEKKDAVSQNCNSIKQTLRSVQKSDSRTRVYLGSVYQTVLTNFMTPLNLRLVKNNQANAALADNQTDFTAARDAASRKFITYSQSLEELILIDCTNQPGDFYNKLEEVRGKRKELTEETAKVKKILKDQIENVVKLKEKTE